MPPLQTEHRVHPHTLNEAPIRRPFDVGLRNSLVAVAAIAVGGIGHLVHYFKRGSAAAWWVWPAIAAGATAACFAQAYLGARIGGRRANNIAVYVLMGCLVALIVWMRYAVDATK